MLGNQQSSLIPTSSSDVKLKKRAVSDMPDLSFSINNNSPPSNSPSPSLLSPALLINQQNGSNKRSRNGSNRDYLPVSLQLAPSLSSMNPSCNGFFDNSNTDINNLISNNVHNGMGINNHHHSHSHSHHHSHSHGNGNGNMLMTHPLSAAAIASSKVAMGINSNSNSNGNGNGNGNFNNNSTLNNGNGKNCCKSPFDTVLEGGIGNANGIMNQGTSSSSSSSISNLSCRNLRKSSNATSKENVNKGLRHFSAKVCAKVEEKGCTTYNEVADELVQQVSSSSNMMNSGNMTMIKDSDGMISSSCGNNHTAGAYDHKNIRRRVYDALNVLMAIDIITKDRKEIRWLGLPDELQQDLQRLEIEEREFEKRLIEKKKIFRELVQRLISLKNLVRRNSSQSNISSNSNNNSSNSNEGDNLQLPFVLINAPKDARVHCEMLEDRTHYFFQFDAPFFINEDIELMRLMGLHRITEDELSMILSCNEMLEAYLANISNNTIATESVINGNYGNVNVNGHNYHENGNDIKCNNGMGMGIGSNTNGIGGIIFEDARGDESLISSINNQFNRSHSIQRKRVMATPPPGNQKQLNIINNQDNNGNASGNEMKNGNHKNNGSIINCDGRLAQLGNLAELDQIGELDRLVSDDSHQLLFNDDLYNSTTITNATNSVINRQHQNRMNLSSPSIIKQKR